MSSAGPTESACSAICSGNRLDEILGIRHPSEDGALRLDHLEADALELGEIRRHAVAQHDALEAAVVCLAYRGMDAHLERHAANHERLDAAVEKNLLQIGGVEGPFAGLIDHRLPRDGIELVDDVVTLLPPHQDAAHRSRGA